MLNPQAVMSLRDASMAAHGLSSLFRLHNSLQAASNWSEKRETASSLLLKGPGIVNRRDFTAVRKPKASHELIPFRLKQRCIQTLALCGALSQSPPSRQKEVSVVTLLASLPPLISQGKGGRKLARIMPSQGPFDHSMDANHVVKGHTGMDRTLAACLPSIQSLLSNAHLSLQGPRPSHLSSSRREATALLSSQARLGLTADVQFVSDALFAFHPRGSSDQGGVRDWIVALWCLERVQSHEQILSESSQGLRVWLKEACEVILRELSRPIDGRTHPSRKIGGPRVASSEEWRASRPRRLASSDELQSASASALRLHQSILGLLENGMRDEELQELGDGLKKVSGRLRQVHRRRVYIGKASKLGRRLASITPMKKLN